MILSCSGWTVVSIAAVAVALLSGCAGVNTVPTPERTDDSFVETGSPGPSPADSGSASPQRALLLPTTCTQFVGMALEDELNASNVPLLTAPDGSGTLPDYGAIGYFDVQLDVAQQLKSPIKTAFNCGYGLDILDANGVGFEVQPMTLDERADLIATLDSGESVRTDIGDAVIFTEVGDATNSAIVHAVYPDSWVTVFTVVGGAAVVARIDSWLPGIYDRVHPGR